MFSFLQRNRRDESVMNILEDNDRLKYRMVLYSFVIGVLSGITILIYRILGEKTLEVFRKLCEGAKADTSKIYIIFGVLILLALFVSFCVRMEPNISGSGIPQVEGILSRRMEVDWKKVLVYKFLGGIATLAAGLSVGREGPSIQMGAAIGEGVSRNMNKMDFEHKYLITSGASAGLAAAFNAPLAGTMFALEEVHKNFSPVVLLSAMVSAVTADLVTKSVLGIMPSLRFSQLNIMPLRYYWSLIILGIVVGISSYFFNNGVVGAKNCYKKVNAPREVKIAVPFMFSGLIGILFPYMIGGGHKLIMDISVMHVSIIMVVAILAIKYFFTMLSFGSGVPGGIFFPLLAIGAVMGHLVGIICIRYLGVPQEFIINFAILAMAGHFAAIVKAPITGIILIFEMTGSFEQLLPLSVVVFTAMITSDILKVEPVYDMLLENILEGNTVKKYRGKKDKKTLIEMVVHIKSPADGSLVSEIKWPQNCLIVSIYRGQKEIIPRGNTKIIQGDMLLAMVNQDESCEALQTLTEITAGECPYDVHDEESCDCMEEPVVEKDVDYIKESDIQNSMDYIKKPDTENNIEHTKKSDMENNIDHIKE